MLDQGETARTENSLHQELAGLVVATTQQLRPFVALEPLPPHQAAVWGTHRFAIGDTAGFLNVPKIKGNHTAMKSGMLA